MKKLLLIVLCVITASFVAYLSMKNSAEYPPNLGNDPYWRDFKLAGELHNVPWVGSFQAESWEFKAKGSSDSTVQVKRFVATNDELTWLLKEWIDRTRTLQMTSTDPYFPGITKELDCAEDLKIKIATEAADRSYFVTMAGNRNYVVGTCHKVEAVYRVYRKLMICTEENQEARGALIVADFFVGITESSPLAAEAFRKLPCSSFTPR